MVFSDPLFLFVFSPVCLLLYWAGGWRSHALFTASFGLIFYAFGGGSFTLLLLLSIVANHYAARAIHRWRDSNPARALIIKRTIIVADLAALCLWKYAGFAVEQFSTALRGLGIDANFELSLALPIAISFFTFQSMSYVIDVARSDADPAPRLLDYAAYILLFPHLIAGPIVRYAQIESELLDKQRQRFEDFAEGAPRFFWGLGKKILIADQVSAIANAAFALPNSDISWAVAWVGSLAFAIQIYFDFSAYSDMAIGLARMFGYRFPENFDHPYGAVSMTDFWRRWHISLSTWFRDYVYIPLGGNRQGSKRTYLNLATVFFLTGLWHGANWTFIAWGAFHGAVLIIERLFGVGTPPPNRAVWFRRAITFVLVCIGWALFRADHIGQGVTFIRAMVVPTSLDLDFSVRQVLTHQRLVWMAIGMLVIVLPARMHVGRSISFDTGRWWNVARLAVVFVIGPLASMYALSSTFSPFLYFQF